MLVLTVSAYERIVLWYYALLGYGVQDIRNYNVPYYHSKFLFGGVSYMLARKNCSY